MTRQTHRNPPPPEGSRRLLAPIVALAGSFVLVIAAGLWFGTAPSGSPQMSPGTLPTTTGSPASNVAGSPTDPSAANGTANATANATAATATDTATASSTASGPTNHLTVTVVLAQTNGGKFTPGLFEGNTISVFRTDTMVDAATGSLDKEGIYSTDLPPAFYEVCLRPNPGWTNTGKANVNLPPNWICTQVDMTTGPASPDFTLAPPGPEARQHGPGGGN